MTRSSSGSELPPDLMSREVWDDDIARAFDAVFYEPEWMDGRHD